MGLETRDFAEAAAIALDLDFTATGHALNQEKPLGFILGIDRNSIVANAFRAFTPEQDLIAESGRFANHCGCLAINDSANEWVGFSAARASNQQGFTISSGIGTLSTKQRCPSGLIWIDFFRTWFTGTRRTQIVFRRHCQWRDGHNAKLVWLRAASTGSGASGNRNRDGQDRKRDQALTHMKTPE
jgi:hypothetical protein